MQVTSVLCGHIAALARQRAKSSRPSLHASLTKFLKRVSPYVKQSNNETLGTRLLDELLRNTRWHEQTLC